MRAMDSKPRRERRRTKALSYGVKEESRTTCKQKDGYVDMYVELLKRRNIGGEEGTSGQTDRA